MKLTLPNFKESYFPHAELTPVTGYPTFQDIQRLRREVTENLASYPSDRGGGELGHIGVGLSTEAYALLSETPWADPSKPLAFSANMDWSSEDIKTLREEHNETVQEYHAFTGIVRTIKNQIKKALEPHIILPLCNSTTEAITKSIPDIFEYLFASYGNITAVTLSEKRREIESHQYDHAKPLENVFRLIQDFYDMSAACCSPEPESGLINMALIVLMNAQIFADSIKDWNLLAADNKTWTTFQAHFIHAQREYKRARTVVTTSDLGFSSPAPTANLAYCPPVDHDASPTFQDPQAYLQALQATHLANHVAPVPEPEPQANAVSSPSDLVMKELLETIKTLTTEVAAVKSSTGKIKSKKKDKKGNGDLYCWTHGLCRHKGTDCNNKATGHKDDATFSDRKGGSVKNCFFLESNSGSSA